MKKHFITGILLILLSFGYSCTKDMSQSDTNFSFITKQISDDAIKEKVLNWQKKYMESIGMAKSDGLQSIEFDYDNLSQVNRPGTLTHALLARQKNYNELNSINFTISFFEVENKIVNALLIKTEKISNDIHRIHYLNLENVLMLTVEVDLKKNCLKVLFKNNNISTTKGLQNIDVGQCTADCISDAYTNHGWASVAAWVVSAFFPEAVAAIALDCAINCGIIEA